MKIAIQVADLDDPRIDGTRVYIFNLLKYFGKLDGGSEFLLYHKNNFNLELTPTKFSNYRIIQKTSPFLWTQIRFAWELWKDAPDVLWMPMAALPWVRRKNLKTIVTIHDLAFKYFPQYFPMNDLHKLNLMADYAIENSDKIIAVSQSTKQDILKFYPDIAEDKIKVIYHGFSPDIFEQMRDLEKEEKIKKELGITGNYILYSGALQPRKNIERLIEAFDSYKKRSASAVKLVLAGEKAWLTENIERMVKNSPYSDDIIMPGRLKFCDIGHLFRGASIFANPSLYEGFGITILEAYAAGVPLMTANNSSLREVGGEGALYFDATNVAEMSQQMERLLTDNELRTKLIVKGKEQLKKFSWEKCAKETLEVIKL